MLKSLLLTIISSKPLQMLKIVLDEGHGEASPLQILK